MSFRFQKNIDPAGVKSTTAQTAEKEKTPIPVWVKIMAVICGIGFVFYYLHHGNDFFTALISGAIMGGLSYLALCVLAGAIQGVIAGLMGPSENFEDTQKIDETKEDESVCKKSNALQTETFELPGAYHHKASIAKVANINPDWRKTCKTLINEEKDNKKIYRFMRTTKKAELVQEPDNPHDKNAVMVLVDGEKVGYISAEENIHVIELMKSNAIKGVSATITGGGYKIVYSEDEMEKGETGPYVEVKVKYRG